MHAPVAPYAAAIVTVLLIFASASTAHAWGDKGHRIVGHLARHLLSPAARAALTDIVGSDDLAAIGLYLDEHQADLERQVPGSRQWHYDNRPVCGARPYADYCPDRRCASAQIAHALHALADPHALTPRRRFAVRVLVHLVADIHQPLHAADNGDRGANDLTVRFPDGRTLSLHAAWDSALVEDMYRGRRELRVARALIAKHAGKAEAWRAGAATDWLAEAHGMARSFAYARLPGFRCGAGPRRDPVDLPADYVRAASEIIEEQLAKAGHRLAHVLNDALRSTRAVPLSSARRTPGPRCPGRR